MDPVESELNSSSSSSGSTLRVVDDHDSVESARSGSIHAEARSVEASVVLSAAVVADIQFVSIGRVEVRLTFGTESSILYKGFRVVFSPV